MGCSRLRIRVLGAVQGVGFRPFVYRTAKALGLKGWVRNTPDGVEIEVEGEDPWRFVEALYRDKPPLATFYSVDVVNLPCAGYQDFEIRESSGCGPPKVFVLPDVSTCRLCLEEMRDPSNRRYRYPFINCTDCGPRFTIIERLPYDRPNTTMRKFAMCDACRAEYEDPSSRRFHAQPISCFDCGPSLWLVEGDGRVAEGLSALEAAAKALLDGKIVAVKGIGGFHLVCLAEDASAVQRLRERKKRYHKPFAVMFPDLETVEKFCCLDPVEKSLLSSVEAPIVILRGTGNLPDAVSGGLKRTGAFLPYSPLHHLLLEMVGKPVVATSGNVSDEPMVYRNREALRKLSGIADLFLLHDRDIARRCDDSVCFGVRDRRVLIRRARGFAPLPVELPGRLDRPVLAVGGHLKGCVALGIEDRAFVSQHIGDLESPEARGFFEDVVRDLSELFGIEPEIAVADLHPGYFSTRWALKNFDEVRMCQHHLAHVLSCACEFGLEEFIGFAFDGTGHGEDSTVWGGEVFYVSPEGCERFCYLYPFALPGGERAVREGWRCAVSLMLLAGVEPPPSFVERVGADRIEFIRRMLLKGMRVVRTTSCGRLFDGFASMAGVADVSHYEGQAAMLFEDCAEDVEGAYTFPVDGQIMDWRCAVEEAVRDVGRGVPAGIVSAKFHNGLAMAMLEVAEVARERFGTSRVVLSGGVFQNKRLLSLALDLFEERGFEVYVNQSVPVNDGGICLGQIYWYLLFGDGGPCA